VLIGGCHPGDCHYVEGNYKMLRRFQLLKRMLKDLGIAEQRLRLEWISAAEGERVKTVINEMTAQLKALGPLGVPQKFEVWDREVSELARRVAVEGEAPAEPISSATVEGEAPTEPQISATKEVAHV
jgi:F420-non-reducing hydrogenase iron-sulfur subunit